MKTEWLRIINENRSGALPEWTEVPTVAYEDTVLKVFDIVDTKEIGGPIIRIHNQGTATYYNGDSQHTYSLRFIKNEEFFDQFRKINSITGKMDDWAKEISRPDYIVYDLSDLKTYFIIHELSEGSIQSKKSKAMTQFLKLVTMIAKSEISKQFCDSFKQRLCYVSAEGCVVETPNDMAEGFMDAYRNLPDPLPLNNKSIEKRGFYAFQSNVVKL